jgi:hypothetical protein
MKAKFTTPKLSKTSKYWYVHYRYEGKQFRETSGLNKIENEKERELCYKELCLEILADLKKGWNPNLPDEIQQDMYIIEALRFARKEKTIYHIKPMAVIMEL